MATKPSPLLCELHAHTRWSDGALTVRDLCDLYGRRGFDVLAVTDHAPREDREIHAGTFDAYLRDVRAEALRARELYDLLVIPGLEITYDDPDPYAAGHAVALGLREYVDVSAGLDAALASARAHGAALVAAHPYSPEQLPGATRGTAAFGARPELAALVDRYELFNRQTLFEWVAAAGLPTVATGDFHRPEHLATWKTMLPCSKDEPSVIAYLRSSRPAYLVRLDDNVERLAA
ncbi:MAG TPA: PHP domain-containing protein [Gaiellaceae bacterium]|nr:PHP domain-containing protein [Gaiellaceae bacterium]